MIVILTIIGLGLALSLFVAHLAYALADRWQNERREKADPDRVRIARDLSYSKLL